jgi:hypothetical protein
VTCLLSPLAAVVQPRRHEAREVVAVLLRALHLRILVLAIAMALRGPGIGLSLIVEVRCVGLTTMEKNARLRASMSSIVRGLHDAKAWLYVVDLRAAASTGKSEIYSSRFFASLLALLTPLRVRWEIFLHSTTQQRRSNRLGVRKRHSLYQRQTVCSGSFIHSFFSTFFFCRLFSNTAEMTKQRHPLFLCSCA